MTTKSRVFWPALLLAVIFSFSCNGSSPEPPEPPAPEPVKIEVCTESLKLPTNACLGTKIVEFKPAEVPTETCPLHEAFPIAEDYAGRLIGMTAYSLIKYPIEDIEWFLRELVKAGGNATEALLVTTWDGTWPFQPYEVAQWEKEMWRDKPWNTGGPDYAFPVFDLSRWNEDVWAKWRRIFELCRKMNITLCVRIQDFCSRKENFLERHWAFWSNVQSWRWGGPMSGGYLHWPPGDGGGGKYIWPHYDRLNAKLVAELEASGVEYYLEDWNELYWTPGSQVPADAPVPDLYENEVHKWFYGDLVAKGCPPDRILSSPQRGKPDSATYKLQVERLLETGFIVEHHGCASPERMRQYANLHGGGRRHFPNGDGPDSFAEGINDGRPGYTEPSFDQAVEMGAILKNRNLLGYIFKGRKFRKAQDLRKADFAAVRGLAKGLREGQ